MEWSRLLSTKRERAGGNFAKAGDLRSEFEKDYHRIIGSASFLPSAASPSAHSRFLL